MTPGERVQLVEQLDPTRATVGDIGTGLAQIHMLRGWLSTTESALLRRQQVLSDLDGAAPAADTAARASKTSQRTARRTAERAAVLGNAPALDALLGAGKVSDEHADALANITARLDDTTRDHLLDLGTQIADAATTRTPEQYRRYLTDTVRRLTHDDGLDTSEQQRAAAAVFTQIDERTGMGVIRGELHPDDYQRVNRRLDAEIDALTKLPEHSGTRREQLRAIALVNLITNTTTMAPSPPAEVVVHIDYHSLIHGPHHTTMVEYIDGTPLPVATARRWACNARIIPVVLNGHGLPLDVGRAQRLATPAQRTALRTMYRTCAIGNCNTPFDRCEIHHTLEWTANHGPTDLDHLIPTCRYHHHRLHEGRWQLQLDPSTRQLTITHPDGTHHSTTLPDNMSERHSTQPNPNQPPAA